jgi:hypothetical protein
MKAREIAVKYAIIFTLFFFFLFFIFVMYLRVKEFYVVYFTLPKYYVNLTFNSDKRLIDAIYSLREGGEVLGLRKDESLEEIKRKLGKPSYAEGSITRKLYGKKSSVEGDEMEELLEKGAKGSYLFYRRNGGMMVISLINDKLKFIQFHGGHPHLPDGVRMGMKMGEIEDIYKPYPPLSENLTSIDGSSEKVPPFDLSKLSVILTTFWTVFFFSFLYRRKDKLRRYGLFLLSLPIAIFVSLFFESAFHILRELGKGQKGFYTAYLSKGIWEVIDGLPTSLCTYFYSELFTAGWLTLLSYLPSRWKWSKKAIAIVLFLSFFLLIYPRFPFVIYSPDGIFLNQTTDLNPFKVLGSLVGVALFAIWFYLLCPPLLSISTPKVPLKFRLKSSFSRFKEKIQEIFLGGEEI